MADLANMTAEQLMAEVARLQAENSRLNAPRALTCKVSAKGAVSVYGLGRFPITLYRSQFERLLGAEQAIRDFIKANEAALKVKEGAVADATAENVTK